MATVPAPGVNPKWADREADKINLALDKVGMTEAARTRWWNHSAYEELGGCTPAQAWQRREQAQVKALVEKLVSEAFASRLADIRSS